MRAKPVLFMARTLAGHCGDEMSPRVVYVLADMFSSSMKRAGECAAAQELDRLRAFFHEIGKRLHEILV
jgi:hypothetical protein